MKFFKQEDMKIIIFPNRDTKLPASLLYPYLEKFFHYNYVFLFGFTFETAVCILLPS